LWEKLPKWLTDMSVKATLIIYKKRDTVNCFFYRFKAMVTKRVLKDRVNYLFDSAKNFRVSFA